MTQNEENLAGDFLREIRKSKKETTQQLGERAGTHNGYFSRVENGKLKVRQGNIDKIAKAYQLTPLEIEKLQDIVFLKGRNLPKIEDKKLEMDTFYQLMCLPLEVRKRIIEVAIAYDALQKKE